jgi:3'(2'), 5'-bisphosphate nucleotidase
VVTPASLDRLGRIAREAGAEIQHVRQVLQSQQVAQVHDVKADGSPVTEADRAAHRVILAALAAWNPDIPAISEEDVIPSYDIRRSWRQFWLIDPLDGTREFLGPTGEYTVNIALVEHDAPVMGVVYAPALDLLYLGGRGFGAWKQEGAAAPERVFSSPPAPGAPLVVAESRSHPSAELEAFLATVPVSRRVQAGSSLKFCWVAEGRADIYPRFGRTMEWDTAAGDCVYRQSGRNGERSSPLRYNTTALAHERFVIGR